MRFMDKALNYIACGLLGLEPRDTGMKITENGVERTLTYGEVIDALAADIMAAPAGQAAAPMPIFDLTKQSEIDRLKKMVTDAWAAAGPVMPKVTPRRLSKMRIKNGDDDDHPPCILGDSGEHRPTRDRSNCLSADKCGAPIREATYHALRPAGHGQDDPCPLDRGVSDGRQMDLGHGLVGLEFAGHHRGLSAGR